MTSCARLPPAARRQSRVEPAIRDAFPLSCARDASTALNGALQRHANHGAHVILVVDHKTTVIRRSADRLPDGLAGSGKLDWMGLELFNLSVKLRLPGVGFFAMARICASRPGTIRKMQVFIGTEVGTRSANSFWPIRAYSNM